MSCDHSTVGSDPERVIFYDCCHTYRKGDRTLTSITKLVKSVWPLKPDFSAADPEVLESARIRGIEVDRLFCQWLNGNLSEIPADGARQDSADLFQSLTKWWNAGGFEKRTVVSTQVLLADDEIAGTADIVGDGIAELKTVSRLEPTYRLQVGGYVHLYEAQYKMMPAWCGVIHVNKSLKAPRWVPFEPAVVVSEFRTALQMWRLVQRLTNGKATRHREGAGGVACSR